MSSLAQEVTKSASNARAPEEPASKIYGRRAGKLRVMIVGGSVAALEAALALADIAPERTEVSLLAPNDEFVYRPMTVREPFSYGIAHRYALEPIVRAAGATLHREALDWIDRDRRLVHTSTGEALEYDALVLALGAKQVARYEHALTIDDAHMDETLHGVVQDIEGGYTHSLAFLAAGRVAWPLPLYELALMSAARAYDAQINLTTTIVTPEKRPLEVFGATASDAVEVLLEQAQIEFLSSACVETPKNGEVVIEPGHRHLDVDRVIALPELDGPTLRGIPLGEEGFIRVDPYGRVRDVDDIYAAGDATDFPLKFGGIAAQQADVVARSIAAAAGAPITPERFHPVIHGTLLTGRKPLYLTARLTGGASFSSEVTDAPSQTPPSKISAQYLAPLLADLDRKSAESDGSSTSSAASAAPVASDDRMPAATVSA